ncbi:prenylcysteine oxidase 1-like [Mytilus galloprovincialis]|uniref:prenylcysteine oxidase 1-like n=1 Tax=Mytilus galloprovincialis TaxID=29158 RepID=UPI003F7C79B5
MMRRFLSCSFVIFCAFIHNANVQKIPTIGIIGAGISGTSTAHFMRELFGDEAKIDIYEKNNVGGRLATVSIGDHEYEVGGAIIHPKNMYMVNFTKILGLDQRSHAGGTLGIWNGEEVVVKTSKYKVVAMAQLLWRYGMDIYNIQNWVQTELMNDFMKIYDIQAGGHAYTSVTDLLAAMNPKFVDYLSITIKDLMKKEGYSDKFINEMVMGALRTNYGQTTDVPAFVGVVSMAGVDDGLWSVKGGNKKVPELLVKHAKANVIEGEVKVVRLVEEDPPLYEIDYKCKNCASANEIKTREYDILVVAKPLHPDINSIKFEGFTTEIKNFPHKYHVLTTTMIKGSPNATYFGLNSPDDFPTELLTGSDKIHFNSIGKQKSVNDVDGTSVYKVFTNTPLDKEKVKTYFNSEDDLRMVFWRSYPEYDFKADSLPPFVLHDKIYYVNAIELAASAMEMSVLSAKNVALLAHHHWTGNLDKIDEPFDIKGAADKTEL